MPLFPIPRLRTLLAASLLAGAVAACAPDVEPPAVAMTSSPAMRAAAVPAASAPPASDPAKPLVAADRPVDVAVPDAHASHPPLPPAACGARAREPSRAPAVSVHRWVDAAGITHYSDRAPAEGAADYRVLEVTGAPAISVEATGHDVGLPDQWQQRAVADALGVQRILRDTLGVAAPHGLKLRVVFVRDADEYARLVGEPSLSASAGAYSPARRTIYVRTQADDELGFMVLRHEITHALVHESIGNLPTPLNEGLAEYFGRYRGGGLGGQIDVGAGHVVVAAAAPAGDGADALVDLLAREDLAFYAADGNATPAREQRYLRAYALVALLMRSNEGRRALAAVLHAQQEDPCRPVVAEAILQREYPGGLRALANAWSTSMRVPAVDVRAY
jgi:hypothetical protein